jgi:hypothetical protein
VVRTSRPRSGARASCPHSLYHGRSRRFVTGCAFVIPPPYEGDRTHGLQVFGEMGNSFNLIMIVQIDDHNGLSNEIKIEAHRIGPAGAMRRESQQVLAGPGTRDL